MHRVASLNETYQREATVTVNVGGHCEQLSVIPVTEYQ